MKKTIIYQFQFTIQSQLSTSSIREIYTNVVEIPTSYDNKLYDDKLFNNLCKEKHYTDGEDMLDDSDSYADDIKELNDITYDVTVVLPVIEGYIERFLTETIQRI